MSTIPLLSLLHQAPPGSLARLFFGTSSTPPTDPIGGVAESAPDDATRDWLTSDAGTYPPPSAPVIPADLGALTTYEGLSPRQQLILALASGNRFGGPPSTSWAANNRGTTDGYSFSPLTLALTEPNQPASVVPVAAHLTTEAEQPNWFARHGLAPSDSPVGASSSVGDFLENHLVPSLEHTFDPRPFLAAVPRAFGFASAGQIARDPWAAALQNAQAMAGWLPIGAPRGIPPAAAPEMVRGAPVAAPSLAARSPEAPAVESTKSSEDDEAEDNEPGADNSWDPLAVRNPKQPQLGNGTFAPPRVPPEGTEKTYGELRYLVGNVQKKVFLPSGWEGPAKSLPSMPGFDAFTRTHVEGHAAAIMRQEGVVEADLYINNPRICPSCEDLLGKMLPPGARLRIHLPNGTIRPFTGDLL